MRNANKKRLYRVYNGTPCAIVLQVMQMLLARSTLPYTTIRITNTSAKDKESKWEDRSLKFKIKAFRFCNSVRYILKLLHHLLVMLKIDRTQ